MRADAAFESSPAVVDSLDVVETDEEQDVTANMPQPEAERLVVASLLLVAMPGASSSVLAPSSDARSP